jgi:hypothetical protein
MFNLGLQPLECTDINAFVCNAEATDDPSVKADPNYRQPKSQLLSIPELDSHCSVPVTDGNTHPAVLTLKD